MIIFVSLHLGFHLVIGALTFFILRGMHFILDLHLVLMWKKNLEDLAEISLLCPANMIPLVFSFLSFQMISPYETEIYVA